MEIIEKQLQRIPPRSSIDQNLYEDDEGDENTSLLQQKQEYMQVQSEADYQRKAIIEREKAIKGLHKQVIEVNDLMKDIMQIVYEDSEMIETIEDHVDITVQNATIAYQETEKASNYQQKAKSKLCIVAIILTVIAALAVIIVVVVTQVRSKPK